MNLRSIVAVLALLPASACTSPASDTPAETVWGEATVVEELSIGVDVGADEYMFSTVYDIAVAPDGTIFVADRSPNRVRAYDSQGSHLRTIGREGQGPGEFAATPALQVMPDGRLATWDYMASRVSLFAPAGEYLDSFHGSSGLGGDLSLDQDVEGALYIRAFNREATSLEDYVLLKYSATGEELGRVVLPLQDMAGARTFVLGFGEGDIRPFPTVTCSAWSPLGYVVTGRNDVYDIELRKREGTVHLTRDVAPTPVGNEEQAEWEAFRQTLVERNRLRGGDQVYEPIPDMKPFFREIFVGAEGRIWVFRYVAAEKRDDIEPLADRPERPLLTWREPWTFDVFEPDGTFLGSVVVPEGLRSPVIRGEHVWGALVDRDGVERVVRLRVVPESQ